MRTLNRIIILGLAALAVLPATAWAQETAEIKADPAALAAFTSMVKGYRERPALVVKTTVAIELREGETTSNSSEVKAEFTFGQNRHALIKLNGFVYYVSNDPAQPDSGVISVIHEKNDQGYFTSPDAGSPYYWLFNVIKDIPFPEMAIGLGEDSIDDVLLQFHPKAINGVVPTAVALIETQGKPVQQITLNGEHERIQLRLDPETKLMQSLELQIAGGGLVQPGMTMTYKHSYEYETFDKPLDRAIFVLEPAERQRTDMLAGLAPQPVRGESGDDDEAEPVQLIGKPAPTFVLAAADGKAIDLDDFRGKVVVLDFWASWCMPCMVALPKLHEVAKWVAAEQVPAVVLTINVWEVRTNDSPDARLESANATWSKRGFTLPIAMDYTDETPPLYGVRGIPTTVVIRPDGVVHALHTGAGPDYVDQLKKEIQEALKAVE